MDYDVQAALFFALFFFLWGPWRAWRLLSRSTIERKDGQFRFSKLCQQCIVDHTHLKVACGIPLTVLQRHALKM